MRIVPSAPATMTPAKLSAITCSRIGPHVAGLGARDEQKDAAKVDLAADRHDRKADEAHLPDRSVEVNDTASLRIGGGGLDAERNDGERAEENRPARPAKREHGQDGDQEKAAIAKRVSAARDHAALQQSLRAKRLQKRSGHAPVDRHLEEIAQLDRARTDDDLLSRDAALVDGSAQHVDRRNPVDRVGADREVDRELAACRRRVIGERRRKRLCRHARDRGAVAELANPAVGIGNDVDGGRPCIRQERRDGDVVDALRIAEPSACRLSEARQHHRSAGALERLCQLSVVSRVGSRAEVDVEGDLRGAKRTEIVDQRSVNAARPGPRPDFLQTAGIDVDERDRSARGALAYAKAHVAEPSVKRVENAAELEEKCRDRDGSGRP